MAHPDLGRRRFIVAAVTLAAGTITPGAAVLLSGRAWALGENETLPRDVLAAIARQMYPHDALDDSVYAEVMDQAMAMVANDMLFAELVGAAGQALDAGAGGDFAAASPDEQLAALQAIDGEPVFAAVLGAVGNRLYHHPAMWALMNYEGPSWQHGGYLDRGAGEIDWLPDESS